MKKRIAINGFGRIGRLSFRNLINNPDVEIVAINDLTNNETLAHLLKWDSAHRKFEATISSDQNSITVNGHSIACYAERNPEALPWAALKVDVVLECTGIFTSKEKASLHLKAGAKKVVLSAPYKGEEPIQTIVLGVNSEAISPDIHLYSNASCTTNCLAPLVKILDQNYGIVQGTMNTVHAFTADQQLQDAPHSDLRRARAASVNIVPTSTGAAKAVQLVYPNIGKKIEAIAIRVPVITGSFVKLDVWTEKNTDAQSINQLFQQAAISDYKGIIEYSTDELVSSDIIANKHSCIFDAKLTKVKGNLVSVSAWYDNEAGYSARLADLAILV